MYQTNHLNTLIDFFSKNKDKTYTALDLVENFCSSIDKATIYRKLILLEKNKIIRKNYNLTQHCYEYQYFKDCENHIHLICKSCGGITHLNFAAADNFFTAILNNYNFIVDKYNSSIYGICKECRQQC